MAGVCRKLYQCMEVFLIGMESCITSLHPTQLFNLFAMSISTEMKRIEQDAHSNFNQLNFFLLCFVALLIEIKFNSHVKSKFDVE